MKIYSLHREQFLPLSLNDAWLFFATPRNLAKITPADMGFEILSDATEDDIYEGMQIEYYVRPLFGIKMKWVTRIGKVQAPLIFVDTQLKGPYALWEHTHTFEETEGGVQMKDVVRYAIPMGIFGRLANLLVVRKKLEHIFDYRHNVLNKLFK